MILHDGDNQQQEYINEGKGVRTGCITQHTFRLGHNNNTRKVEENELKPFIQVMNDECEYCFLENTNVKIQHTFSDIDVTTLSM